MTALTFDDVLAERDAVLAAVEASTDDWEKATIRQAILAVAERGHPFTANDVRDLLPQLTSNNRIGPMFPALARQGLIRRVKGAEVPSTAGSTHGHDIKVWISTASVPAGFGGPE